MARRRHILRHERATERELEAKVINYVVPTNSKSMNGSEAPRSATRKGDRERILEAKVINYLVP